MYQVSDSENEEPEIQKKKNPSKFITKFKNDLISLLKEEVKKNEEHIFELFDPFLTKFLEKIQFEFHLYILLGAVALLFIIILFIINIFFIVSYRRHFL